MPTFQILFSMALLLAPMVIILACQGVSLFEKLGVVVCSFACGMALATSLDLSSVEFSSDIRNAQLMISELSIALALPLLLFSIDVKSSLKTAGKTLKALTVAFLSIVFISIVGALIFQDSLSNISDISGLIVGAYTGGGPNMVSVKTAINADEQVFLTMVTYDIVFSTFYLLFVITIGKVFFRKFLPRYTIDNKNISLKNNMIEMSDETAASYKRLLNPKQFRQTLCALLCSLAAVALAVTLANLLPYNARANGTIILLTSIGLGMSFVSRIRNLTNGFRLGMYLILVFCFTSGSMIDQSILTNINPALAAYISFVLIGSLSIQFIAAKILNIDADTSIVASSAAILSVPLIPVVASALNNKDILMPGYAAGITGYAVGNYLGILVANVMAWLLA